MAQKEVQPKRIGEYTYWPDDDFFAEEIMRLGDEVAKRLLNCFGRMLKLAHKRATYQTGDGREVCCIPADYSLPEFGPVVTWVVEAEQLCQIAQKSVGADSCYHGLLSTGRVDSLRVMSKDGEPKFGIRLDLLSFITLFGSEVDDFESMLDEAESRK